MVVNFAVVPTKRLHMRKIIISTWGLLLLLAVLASTGVAISSCTSQARADEQVNQENTTTAVPDREGMTIKGRVSCNGTGIAHVAVSDGICVTATDSRGFYYLPSRKKYGYVFITIPAGYEAPMEGNTPQFFQYVNKQEPNEVEEKDFHLTLADNAKHAVLAMADFHLADRADDLRQFAGMAQDINQTADSLRRQGYKVYGLSLGDESFDYYWYSEKFDIAKAVDEIKKLRMPFFHCMGNHDNDPYFADDFMAEQRWIKTCMPVYYSINIGRVHYVVLDDIRYINSGGEIGKEGQTNYETTVVDEQLRWLQQDLGLVKDKQTPIVVVMHAPLNKPSTLSAGQQQNTYLLHNAQRLQDLLEPFAHVDILSGHEHMNYNVVADNYYEHNTAAICATWWWTGKLAGNHICIDGTPGGYGVYTWEDDSLSWYYKSYGKPADYQFRAYDMNTVFIDPARYAPNHEKAMREAAHGYDKQRQTNDILINVWNYDPAWTISVKENGRPLPVSRLSAYDPLHILSYDAKRIASGDPSLIRFPVVQTANFFTAHASSPTSTIVITVSDRFGRQYTQTMQRPKAFGLKMS